jgi:TniB protein
MRIYDYLLPFQQDLIDQVGTALDEIQAGGNSQGILLIGASGSGKTHGLDQVASRYPPTVDDYQMIMPCCRLSVPAKADAKAVCAGVRRQLGKPMTQATRADLDSLELDMFAALRAQRNRILIFEEFHNALLSGSPQLRGQTARLLKNVWNIPPQGSPLGWAVPQAERGDHRLVIIVSGTEELRKVFEQDAELASRFGCIIEAKQVGFYPLESLIEFRSVLRSLAERFGLADCVDANDDPIALGCLFACGPHLRKLEKLLERLATLKRRDKAQHTLLELLAMAFAQVGGNPGPSGNPFKWPKEDLMAKSAAKMNLVNKSDPGRA